MMAGYYDVSLEEFPRLAGEESDDKRIQRAILACERGVLRGHFGNVFGGWDSSRDDGKEVIVGIVSL